MQRSYIINTRVPVSRMRLPAGETMQHSSIYDPINASANLAWITQRPVISARETFVDARAFLNTSIKLSTANRVEITGDFNDSPSRNTRR